MILPPSLEEYTKLCCHDNVLTSQMSQYSQMSHTFVASLIYLQWQMMQSKELKITLLVIHSMKTLFLHTHMHAHAQDTLHTPYTHPTHTLHMPHTPYTHITHTLHTHVYCTHPTHAHTCMHAHWLTLYRCSVDITSTAHQTPWHLIQPNRPLPVSLLYFPRE